MPTDQVGISDYSPSRGIDLSVLSYCLASGTIALGWWYYTSHGTASTTNEQTLVANLRYSHGSLLDVNVTRRYSRSMKQRAEIAREEQRDMFSSD